MQPQHWFVALAKRRNKKARAGKVPDRAVRSADAVAIARVQPFAGLCGQTIVRLSSFGVLLFPS